MFCTNCGQEVDNNSDFCPNCGACLKETPDTTTDCVNQSQNNDVQQYNAVQQNNPPKAKLNVLSLVGFIVSIVSAASILFPLLSFPGAIAGMILSIIGSKQIKKTGERGHNFALAGTIVGAVLIGLIVLKYIISFVFIFVLQGQANDLINSYGLIMLAF